MNITGVGERRPLKTGRLDRVPLENLLGEVIAAPNQDVFSFGVDLCYILVKPSLRTKSDCMWLHWVRGMPVAGGGVGWAVRMGAGA